MDTHKKASITATGEKLNNIRNKDIITDTTDYTTAIPYETNNNSGTLKRVAVYSRIAVDTLEQTSTIELLKRHYAELISSRANWEFEGIYADTGLSGDRHKNRDSFNHMMKDCLDGKIDLIITKSISRFAGDLRQCMHSIEQLRTMDPPIGIYFETERLYTLDDNCSLIMSLLTSSANEESRRKSSRMISYVEKKRFESLYPTYGKAKGERERNG